MGTAAPLAELAGAWVILIARSRETGTDVPPLNHRTVVK
jgi:hypothetical protein